MSPFLCVNKNGDRLLNTKVMNLDEMELISQDTDFRGWKTYTVKGPLKVIEFYFNSTTNNKLFDVAIMTLFNLEDTYEVTLLPKENTNTV